MQIDNRMFTAIDPSRLQSLVYFIEYTDYCVAGYDIVTYCSLI